MHVLKLYIHIHTYAIDAYILRGYTLKNVIGNFLVPDKCLLQFLIWIYISSVSICAPEKANNRVCIYIYHNDTYLHLGIYKSWWYPQRNTTPQLSIQWDIFWEIGSTHDQNICLRRDILSNLSYSWDAVACAAKLNHTNFCGLIFKAGY